MNMPNRASRNHFMRSFFCGGSFRVLNGRDRMFVGCVDVFSYHLRQSRQRATEGTSRRGDGTSPGKFPSGYLHQLLLSIKVPIHPKIIG